MARPTKSFETPILKAKVEIKEWINGAEAEYIEAPILDAISERRAMATARAEGAAKTEGIGPQAVHVANHRAIESYVASVQIPGSEVITDPKKVLFAVLNEMESNDYAFILKKIGETEEASKKKSEASNG